MFQWLRRKENQPIFYLTANMEAGLAGIQNLNFIYSASPEEFL